MRRPTFDLLHPAQRSTCVAFASPHSGRDYSFDFISKSVLDAQSLRSSEDAFVEQIYGHALACGAPMLSARAPRAFIDLNRAPDELDPALIEGLARARHNPRINSGLGVIPRVVANGRAIYSGKLPREEADARMADYWWPYHHCLAELLADTLAQFGEAILIDCHSMPHEALSGLSRPGLLLPEVVVGDRFGDSAAAWVVEGVEAAFRGAGFRVRRNAPFAGAFVTQHYGKPRRNQHVVQVELDRSLYMDEAAVLPRKDFSLFLARMQQVVAAIADLGRGKQLDVAAE